jgi:peptidoglycan-associated lipoprotein
MMRQTLIARAAMFPNRFIVATLLSFALAGCARTPYPITCQCSMAHKFVPGTEDDLVENVGDRVFFSYASSVVMDASCAAIKGADANKHTWPNGPDCDSGIIGKTTLDHQAAWLAKNPTSKIMIAGNTDERGTETYNLALGQRRADTVRDYLVARGIGPQRIKTISYGKERPLQQGHDETAWRQNRTAITSVLGANPQACLGTADAISKDIDPCNGYTNIWDDR